MEQLLTPSFYRSWIKQSWKQVLSLGLCFSLVFLALTWYSHRSSLMQTNQSLEGSASMSIYIENKQDSAFTNVALIEEYLKAPAQLEALNQRLSLQLTSQDLDEALTISTLAPYNGIGMTVQMADNQEALQVLEAIYSILETDKDFMVDKDLMLLSQASLNAVDGSKSGAAVSKKRLALGLALAWIGAAFVGLIRFLHKDRKSPYLSANVALNPQTHEKGIYLPKDSLTHQQILEMIQMGPSPVQVICQDPQALAPAFHQLSLQTSLNPSISEGQIVILALEGVTTKQWLSQIRLQNQGGLSLPIRILVLGE